MIPQFSSGYIRLAEGMSLTLPRAVREHAADLTLSNDHPCVYRFGLIEVDFHAGELRKAGLRIHMQDQPLQVLSILLRHPGEIVSREEFRRQLWPADTFVDFDHGLNSAMKRLRDVLDDDPERPRFVETIPRHGYRFIAPIMETAITTVSVGGSPAWVRTVLPAPKSDLGMPTTVEYPRAEGMGFRRPEGRVEWKPWLIILTISALVLGAVAVGLYRATYEQRRLASPSRIVLAVLPFRDLTAVPAQSFVAEGMTQELITHLDKLDPEHVVVSTRAPLDSDREYKRSRPGGDLPVQYVLDGSTRLQGDHLRVSVQLIEVNEQRYVWAESYDERVTDLLQTQAAIATEISAAIRQKLLP